jgi:hypothetical protein
MRLLNLFILVWALLSGAPVVAADLAPAPDQSGVDETRTYRPPPRQVKCLPVVNVWVEPDVSKIPPHELYGTDARKRMPLNLQSSAPYRGDSVLCNYATRSRDVTTSYSLRCRAPRRDQVYRHSYNCS